GLNDLNICDDPGVPEHGNRTPNSGLFFENAIARFHCYDGYRLRGPSKTVCLRNQNDFLDWKPSDKPVCLPEECLVPLVEDADLFNKTYRPGDKLIVNCHEGFQIRYPDFDNMVSICQDDGKWDNLPICQGCLRPMVLPHSYTNISESEFSFPVGIVVHYQCFPGYKLEGTELLECMYNLIWSDSPPRCLEVEECPLPPIMDHGDYICHPQPCNRYIHRTVIEFSCDPGYTLSSDYKYITCQYGEWFPSYEAYCVKSEQSWPNSQDTLLTTWKIVAFTATSVLLVLLLVILAKIFQAKFKVHCHPGFDWQYNSRDPNFVVVDGVPVMLPSYEEAVNSSNVLAPGLLSPAGQGDVLPPDDMSPPAYPGHVNINSDVPSEGNEYETSENTSGSSEHFQQLYPSSMGPMGVHSTLERAIVSDTTGGTASTSPNINIADGKFLFFSPP
uniref:Sushi domain containing 4 n=1 Tax=Latimeria chalumnae TaxID=7897 RepID=H2ZTG3_LATCH